MSQGKYQGKRLSATEVTRLYAAGERDFRGAVLRGCNFRGIDLSGADFSGADIRSTSFVNSTLQKTKFCYVLAGRQHRWQLANLLLLAGFMFFAGSLQGYGGGVLGHYFILSQDAPLLLVAGSMGLAAIAASSISVLRQGLTIRALGTIVIAVTFCSSTTVLISFLSNTTGAFAYAGAVAAAGIISGGCIGAVALLGHNLPC